MGDNREQRLKAALRDNLKRRKAQARGRTIAAADGGERPRPDGASTSNENESGS